MKAADKFRVVITGSVYIYDAAQRGSHGSAILHGAECPRCMHVFTLTIGAAILCCPRCGYVEPKEKGKP